MVHPRLKISYERLIELKDVCLLGDAPDTELPHSNISKPISRARTRIVEVFPVPAGPVIARIRY